MRIGVQLDKRQAEMRARWARQWKRRKPGLVAVTVRDNFGTVGKEVVRELCDFGNFAARVLSGDSLHLLRIIAELGSSASRNEVLKRILTRFEESLSAMNAKEGK